jgi:hypothetical protein
MAIEVLLDFIAPRDETGATSILTSERELYSREGFDVVLIIRECPSFLFEILS